MKTKKLFIGIMILIGIIVILFVRLLFEQQLLNNQVALILTILTFLIVFPIVYFLNNKKK